MKLYILILSLVTITVSACMESKADTSKEATLIPAPKRAKEKVIDREYINHLYGRENDPLKPWLQIEKNKLNLPGGEGC